MLIYRVLSGDRIVRLVYVDTDCSICAPFICYQLLLPVIFTCPFSEMQGHFVGKWCAWDLLSVMHFKAGFFCQTEWLLKVWFYTSCFFMNSIVLVWFIIPGYLSTVIFIIYILYSRNAHNYRPSSWEGWLSPLNSRDLPHHWFHYIYIRFLIVNKWPQMRSFMFESRSLPRYWCYHSC